MTNGYFLTAEELAEKAYIFVRANSRRLMTSPDLANSMIAYIRNNHYHVVSAEIKNACLERAGCMLPGESELPSR